MDQISKNLDNSLFQVHLTAKITDNPEILPVEVDLPPIRVISKPPSFSKYLEIFKMNRGIHGFKRKRKQYSRIIEFI